MNLLSYYILVKRDSPIAIIVWAWQYALLMQIPEGIAWLQLNNAESDLTVVGRIAMILNVTQPIALFVATRASPLRKPLSYSHVALFMYLTLIAAEMGELWDRSTTIAPLEGCPHLNLGYWNVPRGLLYVFASIFVMSEIRFAYWILINTSIFMVSLILSGTLYSCGVGSVWCWLIFMTGPILVSADLLKDNCIRVATGKFFEKPKEIATIAPVRRARPI